MSFSLDYLHTGSLKTYEIVIYCVIFFENAE